jgi:hypothetical protein
LALTDSKHLNLQEDRKSRLSPTPLFYGGRSSSMWMTATTLPLPLTAQNCRRRELEKPQLLLWDLLSKLALANTGRTTACLSCLLVHILCV